MIVLGLMAALFLSRAYDFIQFQKTSEVVIDVNEGMSKVLFSCLTNSSTST
jgi:hypothetical protein